MKSVLTIAVACSMLALAGIAQADSGMPSQSTLDAMGLSGVQVMSDADALNVRGFGYYGYSPKKSSVIAYGKSYAHVSGHGAKAGSRDGYYAEGTYYAGGKHGSYAKIEVRKSKRRGGGPNRPPRNGNHGGGNNGPPHGGGGHVKTKTVKVYAGGYAHASAY